MVENDLAYILFPAPDAPAQARALALQERRLGSPALEVDLLPLALTPGPCWPVRGWRVCWPRAAESDVAAESH